MYPGGGVQPLWEASLLRSHVHPSVSKFADSLVSKQQNHAVQYKGDPLADLALMPFLNRMAYKNPKARDDKNQGRGVRERERVGVWVSCLCYFFIDRATRLFGVICVCLVLSL